MARLINGLSGKHLNKTDPAKLCDGIRLLDHCPDGISPRVSCQMQGAELPKGKFCFLDLGYFKAGRAAIGPTWQNHPEGTVKFTSVRQIDGTKNMYVRMFPLSQHPM